MLRKILKILFILVLFVVILDIGLKLSLLYVTRALPWQKPTFDFKRPLDPGPVGPKGVLIFSKTNGYRHNSIEPAIAALKKAGKEKGWQIYNTESGAFFNDEYLQRFKVVVFLSTTGDILTSEQEKAFEDWEENGGGYVGIHAAADCEYGWSWYDQLLGTHFRDHPLLPHISDAEIITDDSRDPTTLHLPSKWHKTDEWYNFKQDVRGKKNIHILLSLNEASYISIWPFQRMGGDHPLSWTNTIGKGRMFYTAMGHNTSTFRDQNAIGHIIAGIGWAGRF